MRAYRFMCYTHNSLKAVFEADHPNVASACVTAEFLLSPESDSFYDKVRFFQIDANKIHASVYILERNVEQLEEYGL